MGQADERGQGNRGAKLVQVVDSAQGQYWLSDCSTGEFPYCFSVLTVGCPALGARVV